jgi:hypothetical protein
MCRCDICLIVDKTLEENVKRFEIRGFKSCLKTSLLVEVEEQAIMVSKLFTLAKLTECQAVEDLAQLFVLERAQVVDDISIVIVEDWIDNS